MLKQEITIDATNAILGRLSSYVAKQALQGKTIKIVNSEKAIIIGSRDDILGEYKEKVERGNPHHGPFFPRTAHLLMKRTIRGMLEYKTPKGRAAFERIKCYIGNEKKEQAEKIKTTQIATLKVPKYVTVEEICKHVKG